MPTYRHYFNMPMTGSFLSQEEDFQEAVSKMIQERPEWHRRMIFNDLAALCDTKYSIDNIEPVDMPGNPGIIDDSTFAET